MVDFERQTNNTSQVTLKEVRGQRWPWGLTLREEPLGLTHLNGFPSPSSTSSPFCLFSAASALLLSISSFILLFSSWTEDGEREREIENERERERVRVKVRVRVREREKQIQSEREWESFTQHGHRQRWLGALFLARQNHNNKLEFAKDSLPETALIHGLSKHCVTVEVLTLRELYFGPGK